MQCSPLLRRPGSWWDEQARFLAAGALAAAGLALVPPAEACGDEPAGVCQPAEGQTLSRGSQVTVNGWEVEAEETR
ncbi:hypothetical protein Srot_1654 [Segniliparus rotundus DSM 44985]|uniref:Uncharacterized protein n=1 Tax=Segniliparus rotundus (strain ATCC BAA-972 / CDC 1076 / CIP 108378 / DSM 44985 / JCM 13578) TaxID=640132 RepID=D6Z835_SEGRD|nr:hypothetical protein Srot_1654 [Segniliparus rotundus DSM 44985]